MKTGGSSRVGPAGQSLSPQSSSSSPFRVGRVMAGTVISKVAPQCFYVDFGHHATTAYSGLPLKPGNRIRVRVTGTQGRVTLKLLGEDDREEAGLEERLEALLSTLGLPVSQPLMEQALVLARFGMRPDRKKIEALSEFLGAQGAAAAQEMELAAWLYKKNGVLDAQTFRRLRPLAGREPGSWARHVPVLARGLEEIAPDLPKCREAADALAILRALPDFGPDTDKAAKSMLALLLEGLGTQDGMPLAPRLGLALKATVGEIEKQQRPGQKEQVFLQSARNALEGLDADALLSEISSACGQGAMAAYPLLRAGKAGMVIKRSFSAGPRRWLSFSCLSPEGGRANAYADIAGTHAQVNIFSYAEEMLDWCGEREGMLKTALANAGISDLALSCRTAHEEDRIDGAAVFNSAVQGLDIVA